MTWLESELENVACDLCGATHAEPVITRPDGLRAVECPGCGLCYLNPRPRAELVGRIYERDYYEKSGGAAATGYADYTSAPSREAILLRAMDHVKLIAEQVPLRGKAVLEIGSATGEFTHLLAEAGALVTGSDLSEAAVRMAKERYQDLEFIAGPIEAIDPERRFDIITAFEVIEHVLSPSRFLAQIRSRLRPGGIAVLSTPNYGCAKAVGPERWLGFHTSFEHLYFYTADSLRRLAAGADMRLEAWYTGGSTGRTDRAEPAWRTAARSLADKVGLLAVVRRGRQALFRRSLVGTYFRFAPEGAAHTLLVFLKTGSDD